MSHQKSRVPAGPVRDRIGFLTANGQSVRSIASWAQVSPATIHHNASGRTKEVHLHTAAIIMEMGAYQVVDGHKVPGDVVRIMLEVMRSSGLPLRWVYRRAGIPVGWRGHYSGQRVSWETYSKIKAVFDELEEKGWVV
jgi:hypothetical protein